MAKQVSSIRLAKRVSSIATQLRVIGGISPADSVPRGGAVYSYAGDGGGRVELWIFVGWDRLVEW
jgi:hypothetical protein